MTIYNGYVYLWYDTKAKLFYLGGHFGLVEDSYVCSNTQMLRAYRKRPHTFKFKVLQYIQGTTEDLRVAEQNWLDMIKDHELYWTPNIYNKTVRYYNRKKSSSGGNGIANKGKLCGFVEVKGKKVHNNSYLWKIVSPDNVEYIVHNLCTFCKEHKLSKTPLYHSYKQGKPCRLKHRGWQMFLLDGTPARNRQHPKD